MNDENSEAEDDGDDDDDDDSNDSGSDSKDNCIEVTTMSRLGKNIRVVHEVDMEFCATDLINCPLHSFVTGR
jgi:hypothetical protein